MQIRKALPIILAGSLFICLFLSPNLASAGSEWQFFQPLSNKSSLADEAFTSMTKSFEQMTILLRINEFHDGYYLLNEYKQEKEVYDHLKQVGFESSLANRIIAAYLVWEPDLGKMVLIPADSLPIIKPQDRAQTQYFCLDDNNIIFRLYFYDCYQMGDKYVLFVSCTREDVAWLINEWQLFAVN